MAALQQYTITKAVVPPQGGGSGLSSTYSLLVAQSPNWDYAVNFGTPVTINDGVGIITVANIPLLYLLSDNLDCTVKFYSATNGGGSLEATISLIAGQGQEWDGQAIVSAAIGGVNILSVIVTPVQTVNGIASTLTVTNVHIREGLSA